MEIAEGWDTWIDQALEFIRQMNFDGRLGAEENWPIVFTKDDYRGDYFKEFVWIEGKMPDVQTNQVTPYLEWHFPKLRRTSAIQIIYSES